MPLFASWRHRYYFAALLPVWLAAATPVSAAVFVPVTPTATGYLPGGSYSIEVANAYASQNDMATGPAGLVTPGDHRVAINSASATMHAEFSSSKVELKTFTAARDVNTGDFYPTDVTADIREAWFYVAPTGLEIVNQQVPVNVGLAWASNQRVGAEPTATLSPAEGLPLATLTSRSDFEPVNLRVGHYYRVDITHRAEVKNGTILSSADFQVSLAPLTSLAVPDPLLPGDFNDDGVVNAADYTMLRDGFTKPYNFALDANGDGVVNMADTGAWKTWYGTNAPSFAVTVPEPAAVLLAALACLGAVRARR